MDTTAIEGFRLSPLQQQTWQMQQHHPDSPLGVRATIRIDGPLDTAKLADAWAVVCQQHEILHTAFVALPGMTMPLQVISDDAPQPLGDGIPAPLNGPITSVSASLERLAPTAHMFHLSLPALCADRASLGVLLRDLVHVYTRPSLAPPSDPPPQYVDLSEWQHELLLADEMSAGRAYWQGQARTSEAPLPWSGSVAVPPALASEPVRLSGAAVRGLRLLTERTGIGPATALLTGWSVFLARSTGVAGATVAWLADGRTYEDLQGACGLLARYLPLHLPVNTDRSFAELARQVGETVTTATDWQYCFAPAEHDSAPTVGFEYTIAPEVYSAPDALFSLAESHVVLAPLALKLVCVEHAEHVDVTLEYTTDQIDAVTAAQIAEQVGVLVEALLAQPERPVGLAPIISHAQRKQLLRHAIAPASPAPADTTLADQVARYARETPAAIAVVGPDGALSYAELAAQVERLAGVLRARGVSAECPVATYLPRSGALVLGMLAILRAGGVYVPLDTVFPAERLAQMLSSARPTLILTETARCADLPEDCGPVLALDALPDECAEPLPATQPDQLAYIIYTSGSTGVPKGVAIPHRQIAHYTAGVLQRLDLAAPARYAIVSTFAADLGMTSVFAALWSGGALYVPDDETVRTPDAFGRYMRDHRIDCLKIVPAHLQALLAGNHPADVLPRQRLILGGDTLPLGLLNRLGELAPSCVVLNHYGPTETTVGTLTCCPSTDGLPGGAASVPLGFPLRGSAVYVLDAQGEPAPYGVAGELHIGGGGVARGYAGDPALTASRFLPDPFSATPGSRMYRTGDRARLHANGAIEFLGRVDDQVKIRGYRVEPGDVAAVLRTHPAIRDAAVVVRTTDETTRLLAYVVPRDQQTCDRAELQAYMLRKLPPYMQPDAIVVLERLPLNANGKVDRQALPAPEQLRAAPRPAYVAPRTATEATLADIWAQVLEQEQIGIHDNFFALGGHSLRAMHLVSRASAALGCDLSINQLFTHPTIADLSPVLQPAPIPATPAITEPAPLSSFEQPAQATIETRPLLPLLLTRAIPPVDAISLGPIPRVLQQQSGMAREELIRTWCDGMPTIKGTLDTPLGRIGGITLPVLTGDVYTDQPRLVREIIAALELAKTLGVRVVSMTGLLPSATEYGAAVMAAIKDRPDLPALSTGHATTTTAMILTIRAIVEASGRDLQNERVAFLGLGSVGSASLRMLLQCLPHPREIALCDVYSKLEQIEALAHELRHTWGYRGIIRVLEAHHHAPAQLYDSSLIIGATNVAHVIETERLRPGTLLVDDSAPHCFDPAQVIARFEERGDILFTEGGVLRSPMPIAATKYLPQIVEAHMPPVHRDRFARHDPWHIMGCVFSGLLSTRYPELVPTIGLIDPVMARQHYTRLNQLGFTAARLHCEGYVLPEAALARFRQRFATR